MTIESAAPKTTMQRFLDGVEKVGNMVPHPVVIFLILIGIVIVLSAVLSLFGAAVTFERINPDTHQVETATHGDPQPAEHRRHPLHVFVADPELHELHRGRAHDRRDDRRRRRRGIRPGHGADPQARHRLAGLGADLHPVLRRHPRQHRGGCRLSGPDPARRHRLSRCRAPSARRPGARLRRRRRRLHGQHADQAARRRARRVHQRRGPSRRSQPLDRPGLERLVLDRVGAVPDRGHRLHHRPDDRAAPGHLRSEAGGRRHHDGAGRHAVRAGIARPALRRLRPARADRGLLPADAAVRGAAAQSRRPAS